MLVYSKRSRGGRLSERSASRQSSALTGASAGMPRHGSGARPGGREVIATGPPPGGSSTP